MSYKSLEKLCFGITAYKSCCIYESLDIFNVTINVKKSSVSLKETLV